MELPAAYIPADRRLALARGDELPERSNGAVLFADISGFTPLTEQLARELGPRRGAEELTRQLNIVYSALIAEVDAYRGSVIGFSGDAITCWFGESAEFAVLRFQLATAAIQNPKPKTQNSAAGRAVACALALQRVMRDIAVVRTLSGAEIVLAIKVAVAAGPVRRFAVGDPQIQHIDVLAGRTLERLAAAEHAAGRGEVAISAEVAEALGERLRIDGWRDGEHRDERFAIVRDISGVSVPHPWPTPNGALDDEHVRPWLLPTILERLRAGQGQFLAELRPAVALFTRFSGIDYDNDTDAAARLDTYIRWVQHVIARYEGALLQLTIGDKGSYFYVAFGAPVAHDDDPARAAAAALALLHPPGELGIQNIQVGISRGRMRAGAYGGPTRRTYGVLGDEVNLAARLMSHAKLNQILVSQSVADSIARRFIVRSMSPIRVKGKDAPVAVSAVIDQRATSMQRPASLYTNPLIGRAEEVQQALLLMQNVQAGSGTVLRIEGAVGVGKSHFAAAIAERARSWGMRVAAGVCQSTTEGVAYAPWNQILHVLMGLSAEPGASPSPEENTAAHIAAIEAFVTGVNQEWALRLPLLGDLMGVPLADNATTAAFDAKLRQQALFDLVSDMLAAWSSTQPLLVLIDDAHWMDEASKGLTLAVARSATTMPLLLVLVQRPTETALLPELNELRQHERVDLDVLTAAGIAELARRRLGGPVKPIVLDLIEVESQGNPFFAEEVIDALGESNMIERHEQGEWRLSAATFAALRRANMAAHGDEGWRLTLSASLTGADLGLPDTIQGIVLSRIDRLPEAHKLTLKVASVIGRSFSLDLLRAVHPDRPTDDDLLAQMRLLEKRDFTRLDAPENMVYLFKHNVTRDTAYDTLLFDQRRQVHRAIGTMLEQIAPEAIAQLAYHTHLGEDWAPALRYHKLAGQQAQKLFANHEAIEYFRRALHAAQQLAATETSSARQQIHAGLGQLLTSVGRYEQALDHLKQALSLAAAYGDAEGQARVCRWISYTHEFRSEFAQAQEWIDRGLAFLGAQTSAIAAELQAVAGLIAQRLGQIEQATTLCDRGIEMAEAVGDQTALAFARNSRGLISLMRGESEVAISQLMQVAELYGRVQNVQGFGMAYNAIGSAYSDLGRWAEATHFLTKARKVFKQTGDELHQAFADNNLGGIALKQGRLQTALDAYQSALQALEQLGSSRYVIAALNMNLGGTYVRGHQTNFAREHLRISLALFEQVNSRDFLPELYRYFAEAALLDSDDEQAADYAQQALDTARELTMRGEEGCALRVAGEVAASRGQAKRAQKYLRESIAVLGEVGHVYDQARSELALASVLLAKADHNGAREQLGLCLPVFERLEAVLDLAQARELAAAIDQP